MRRFLLPALALVLALTGCGGADDGGDVAGDAATGVRVGTADSEFGTILVDGHGNVLYLFDNDAGGESACYDSCAQTWPPLVGEAEATGDADPSLVGTTEREDGSTQVTYAGFPLYHYAADSAAGDVNGQGVGGVWWVVGPDGSRITDDGSAGADDAGGADY